MLITRPQINAVMAEIAKELSVSGVSPSKSIVVAVGGTAMCINQIRMASYDIDLYCDKDSLPVISAMEERLKSKFGDKFRLDLTDLNLIWGQVAVGDIEKSPVFSSFGDEDDKLEAKAIDPATLFILKSCSARDRDIDDVGLIAGKVTIDEILERLGELSRFNLGTEFLEMVLSEIQAHYFEPVSAEMIDKINLDRKRKQSLIDAFGVTIGKNEQRHAANS